MSILLASDFEEASSVAAATWTHPRVSNTVVPAKVQRALESDEELEEGGANKTEDFEVSFESDDRSTQATMKLWTQYKNGKNKGDVSLRNALIEVYLPFVQRIAEALQKKLTDQTELDDLVSDGVFGLIDAIDAFDLSRGVKFETYSVPRIRGAMLDSLREIDWVPVLTRSRQGKMKDATKEFFLKQGRFPTEQELEDLIREREDSPDLVLKDCKPATMQSFDRLCSKENKRKGGVRLSYEERPFMVDSHTIDPTERLRNADIFKTLFSGASQKERLAAILYCYEDLSMKQVAAQLDLSEGRISQIFSSVRKRIQTTYSRGDFALN